MIKKFLTKKSPGPDSFTRNFTKEGELIIIFLKTISKNRRRGNTPNSLCKANITMVPNPEKHRTEKIQANNSDEYDEKITN